MATVRLRVDKIFHDSIVAGKTNVLWFRGAKANLGDMFSIPPENYSHSFTYEIVEIEPICLGVFCDEWYSRAGFISEYDARQYYEKLYGDPHEFYATEGFMHGFDRVCNEGVK